MRALVIWSALAVILAWPLIMVAYSPLLQWREPVYIASGFSGVLAMVLLVLQPLLAAGLLPGLTTLQGRRVHRWIGAALVLAVMVHVGGLWITSPPDVVDALLFVSPTPFSVWGVIAMWAIFGSAALAIWRRKMRFRLWRAVHVLLAAVIVVGCVVHAALIEGTMEIYSKIVISVLLVAIAGPVLARLYLPHPRRRS